MILDGKAIAERITAQIKEEAISVRPGLAVVQVGDDPASSIYVSRKEVISKAAGFLSQVVHLPKEVTEEELLARIETLNGNHRIHGILVQLPLPEHLDPVTVQLAISPLKDVDGLHPENMGLLFAGKPRFVPCTPKGVMRLLDETKIPLAGKHAVVVGRSNLVGKPLAQLLLLRDATVTVCHSKTPSIASITQQADILVSAVGKPDLISADHVKTGAAVIDVGTTRVGGKLRGDVAFDEVKEKAAWLTPVPGGVGPMTIAMLLENTLEAARR